MTADRRKRACIVALVATICLVGTLRHAGAGEERPRVYTNQSYIEDASRQTSLPLADPQAMFAVILDSLPDRVKVYPTENYYYFRFFNDGTPYAGNIRLDARIRDEGKLHFAYFPAWAEWLKNDEEITYVVLGPDEGVNVERVERFLYRVTYRAKSVLFELNDLSNVTMPAEILGPYETFLGPVFDESGIRFFLVFNPLRKIFHFVLDETVPVADELVPGRLTDRILIGKRSGFAFYRDHYFNRKILIGSYQANTLVNNYFDGPFDQLPDNFLEGDELRQAILQIDPSLAGQLDRFGVWPGGKARYLVGPYIDYRLEQDLYYMHECAALEELPFEWYHACLVGDGSGFADYPVPPGSGSGSETPGTGTGD